MTNLDIIFISYQESQAEQNWHELKSRFPRAKRVHGIQGIAEAHVEAAKKSATNFFFVVDGDNKIRKEFDFSFDLSKKLSHDSLYVWRCFNPANSLIYGFGAVKLYNKNLLSRIIQKNFFDLATSVSLNYEIVDIIASETHFFMTPEEAWRGAFRECAKLASGVFGGAVLPEASYRLRQWCSAPNPVVNASWVLKGATQGRFFGEQAVRGYVDMSCINDYGWLKHRYMDSLQDNHE